MPPAPGPRGRALEARTAPPLPPARFVDRPRLRDLIESAVPLGVALMVAPGGFGKTVAMADFASHAAFPVAWLSISPADADLVAFVEALVAAVRRVLPRFGRRALPMARQGGPAAIATIADEFAAELSDHGHPLGLVLDDFHQVDGVADVTRLVGALLERAPATCFVAVASRTLPALPHARLLAAGRMLGVAAEDLRFTRHEVAAFLGAPPDDEPVERVHEGSGGWAAALVLGEEAADNPDALADYLEAEVWGQQPPEVRAFLLRASIPSMLTDDVCVRVLGEPRGVEYLGAAHRAGLFVAALPDGGWRLHDLFRDFLRAHLRKSEPETWTALNQRVADELLAEGRPAEAIGLLIGAGLHAAAADALLAHADELADAGRWGAIRRWFERLPARVVDARPRLLTLKGRALRPIADADTVLRAYDRAVERALAKEDRVGAAEALGHRAVRLSFSGRHAEAAEDCRRAHELLGDRGHPILATVLRVEGTIFARTGEYDRALTVLSDALARAQRHRQAAETAMCERSLGWTHSVSGNVGAATAHYERATRAWEEMGDVGAVAEVKVSLGHTYREQGAMDLARRSFEQAVVLSERAGQRRALGFALDNLAIMDREAGAVDSAIEALDRALGLARELDDAELLSQCLDQLAQCHRVGGAGPRSAETLARQAIAEAERALNGPVAARARATLAAALLAQGRTEEAWSVAREAAEALEARGSRADLVRARLAAAAAGWALGHTDWPAELAAAARALPRVAALGFLRAELLALGATLHAMTSVPEAREWAEAILAAGAEVGVAVPTPADQRSVVALPRLDVHLLGRPELLVDGAPPAGDKRTWGRQMVRELFFLLEANRQGLSAESIVDRLWPDAPPGSGQSRLWVAVHGLRSTLAGGDRERGKVVLLAERGGHYRLNPDLAISTDVARFEATASQALALALDSPAAVGALAAADAAYGGEYLDGADTVWPLVRRRDLARLHARVLRRRVEFALRSAHPAEAAAHAERLVKEEPFNESACELLIRAYLAAGERERARSAYRRFARRLDRHMDATPPAALGELVG